ncbi:MAG: electron transfer flavoprotein subunit beta/FixA family protein [Nitrososphaerales archaeon]
MSNSINVAIMIKLEPDLSEGNVSYNPDGTLNRSQTRSILGAHSAIATRAAFYSKVLYDSNIKVCTMGPPTADIALKQSMEICNADELHLYSDRSFAGADTLGTAEAIKTGIEKMGSIDLVISGHRAVDGETGQTGPQTAWKLGFNFLGNVIDYNIDTETRTLHAKRLIEMQELYNVLEEIECPLPALISIDPSYKERYTTVSQRLKYVRLQKEAAVRVQNYKQSLKIWSAKDLGVDPKYVGLPGSPTIVYKVERIPKAKASRKAKVIDSGNTNELNELGKKLLEMVNSRG